MSTPRTAAGEEAVGRLHSKINALYENVGDTLLRGFDSEDEGVRMAAAQLCSPAMLTSMSNWVKQNDITCQPEQTDKVAKNKELLREKKKRGARVANLSYIDPQLDPEGTSGAY